MRARNRLAACIGFGACLFAARPAAAHPLAPTLLDLRQLGGGRVAVTWKASLLSAPGADVAPILPADCRAESAPNAVTDGDSITRTWTLTCPASLAGRRIGFNGLEVARIAGLVRVTLLDGRVVRGVVSAEKPLLAIPAAADPGALARVDARRGLGRILTGFDTLLFLAGLTALVGWRGKLIEALAAFTVAQALMLALVGLGVIAPPPASIDLLPAGGVFLLAVELARDPAAPAPGSWARRWPWAIALAFGIAQGLSLGGAWRAADAAEGSGPLRLIAFNLGVDAGQIALLAALFVAVLTLRRLRLPWPRWTAQVPLYAMGSLAAFWCLERAAALWH